MSGGDLAGSDLTGLRDQSELCGAVFFAAQQLSSYYTGQVPAPIGGETLPG